VNDKCFGLFTLVRPSSGQERHLKRNLQSYRVPVIVGRGECRKEISFCLRDNVRVYYNFLVPSWSVKGAILHKFMEK